MILNNSITIDFPTNIPSIVLNKLDIVIMDRPQRKVVQLKIHPFPYLLTLWSGSDYDAIGDYTQAQIEEKVREYIGNNPKAQLEKLFLPPNKR